jgi:hypothetical protein
VKILIFFLLLFPTLVWADPFLVCDPVATGSWDKIEIAIDGGMATLIDPQVMADTKLRLYYDLKDVTVGGAYSQVEREKGCLVWCL